MQYEPAAEWQSGMARACAPPESGKAAMFMAGKMHLQITVHELRVHTDAQGGQSTHLNGWPRPLAG